MSAVNSGFIFWRFIEIQWADCFDWPCFFLIVIAVFLVFVVVFSTYKQILNYGLVRWLSFDEDNDKKMNELRITAKDYFSFASSTIIFNGTCCVWLAFSLILLLSVSFLQYISLSLFTLCDRTDGKRSAAARHDGEYRECGIESACVFFSYALKKVESGKKTSRRTRQT